MICVYKADETNFDNNGLAVLEPTSCELSLTINGAWVLTLVHPFDENGKYLELDNAEPENENLKKGNIIKVTGITAFRNNDCDSTQLFRIYDTVKNLTSITVTAFPVGMEATYDAIIEELKLNNKNGKQVGTALSNYLTEQGMTKYTLSVSSSFTKKRSVHYKNTNLIAALCGSDDGSFVNKFNAEISYDNYTIHVKKRLGTTTDFDVRLGKNLTGLSFEIDDSAVVTRLYPISQDDLRLYDATDRRPASLTENHYIDSEDEIDKYPHIRASFVDVPYSLIDTDIDSEIKTNMAELTETVYNNLYDDVLELMQAFWTDVCEDNEFSYTGTMSFDISLIPEFVQDNIEDISETIANNVLGTSTLDNLYVEHPSLRSWLTKAIKAGIDWIADVDLPEKGWVQNQDNSYSYGTDLRLLANEWAYIDRKMSYFGNDTKWVQSKDDSFEWDWVQKKGQRNKFGNNLRYLARDEYAYVLQGVNCDTGTVHKYWLDKEGWWDGEEEETEWNWRGSGTAADPYWFGESDPAGDNTKYAHDGWYLIRTSTSYALSYYYFDSDGYLVDSLTETLSGWKWQKEKDKWYLGSTNKNNRANYLSSQWMEIDGDWRQFDSNGYVIDLAETIGALTSALSDYLTQELETSIQTAVNGLYDLLYENMTEYCSDLYENGLDKPAVNVSVDFVDLSRTQEYASFANLEKICLGDDVAVHDPVHGIDTITERVMGLTYDCLRGCNTQINVGGVSSVTSLFDTSVKGSGNEQRLVAGKNVTISGNVIDVAPNAGDVIAGDKVSVTQLATTGTPIARISVNGTPTTIYAVGTNVSVNPIKQDGDKIATITVGEDTYDIYADTGLKYWVETQTDIYRTGTRSGELFVENDAYYFNRACKLIHTWAGDYQYAHWNILKANDTPCLIAAFRRKFGTAQRDHVYKFILVSPRLNPEYSDGVLWNSQKGISAETVDSGEVLSPVEDGQEGSLVATRACYTNTFTYRGIEWKSKAGNICESSTTNPYELFNGVQIIDVTDTTNSNVELAKLLIDAAGASTSVEDIVGISNQDHILYYNDDKEGNYDTENRDDAVYISKDGVFNGSEFRINGVAIGSFYKTRLYLGTTYASSITLSDSYTKYDLLMIETYNQDDKNNLASTVNVSDLSTGSYVGVNEYLMYSITNARTLTFHEAPSDNNHSRYIKAVYGLRTSHESGTEAPIQDVTVDGSSVVAGGVASIDLTGKQNRLTAGSNIQIVNNTISATDTKYTAGTNVHISEQNVISADNTTYSDFAGSAHGLVPAASSGDSGKYLKGDGSWDSPASGTTYTAGTNIQISNQNVISATDTTYDEFDGTNSGLVPEPQSGDSGYLKYDGTWDTPTTVGDLDDLSDVNISSPSDGQILKYDNASSKWVNANNSGGVDLSLRANWDYFSKFSEYQSESLVAGGKKKGWVNFTKSSMNASGRQLILEHFDVLARDANQNTVSLDVTVSGYGDAGTSMTVDYIAINNTSTDVAYIGYYATFSSPKAGSGGGGGGASEINDLTDVNITTPSNGQVLSYDSTNQEWVNTTPSGGGGNSITYGSDSPSSSGNDGDLYIMLSGSKKVAEFLYMSNHWSLIDGEFDLMSLEMIQSRRNSTTLDTYTATEECTVLCLNQNVNGEASTKSLTANITTDGTILYTDLYSTNWSSPNRCQCTRLSLIHLYAGESVELNNAYEGNYTTQLHVVLRLNSFANADQITRVISEAKADNNFGTSATYSLLSSGLYFAIGFQTRGTGGGTTYATISTSNDAEIMELLRSGANESISVALVEHPNNITFNWNNQSDYATKGYAVYKLR